MGEFISFMKFLLVVIYFDDFWVRRKQDIDGELALHLKRLSRKDPTTKVNCNSICIWACYGIFNSDFVHPGVFDAAPVEVCYYAICIFGWTIEVR